MAKKYGTTIIKLFFFIALCYATAFSQSSKTDSLTVLLNKSENNKEKIELLIKRSKSYKPVEIDLPIRDAEEALRLANQIDEKTLKVDALLQVAGINSRANKFDKALDLARQGLQISKKINYIVGEMNALTGIGRNLIGLGNDTDAMPYLENAKQIAAENNFKKELKNLYNLIGLSYRKQGKLEESLESFNLVIPTVDSKKENKLLALLYMNKANTLNELHRFEQAIDNHLLALAIFEENKDEKGIMQINNNLVPLFVKVFQWQNAQKYAQKTMRLLKKNPNDLSSALVFDNYALTLYNLKKKDSVNFYFAQSLQLFKKINDAYNIARITHNIGQFYLDSKKYNIAENQLKVALQLREKLKIKIDIASTLTSLAATYLGLNDLKQAEKHLNKAKISIDNEPLAAKENYLRVAANFHKINGDFEKSLKKSEELLALKDSMYKESELVSVIKKEKDLEIHYQKKQLSKLKYTENLINKNRISYGLLLFLVFLLALYLFVRWKKVDFKKKALLQEKLEIECIHNSKLEELEKLKSSSTLDYIVLKNKSKVYLESLIYIKSEDHYLYLYSSNNKKIFIRGNLSEIIVRLPLNFIKCHRSYIVNKNHIKQFLKNEIALQNGIKIPISRGFKI